MNKLGIFHLKKRQLLGNMIIILKKRRRTCFANTPGGKTRNNGYSIEKQNFGSITRRNFV